MLIYAGITGGPGIVGWIGDYLVQHNLVTDPITIKTIVLTIDVFGFIGSFGGAGVIAGGILVLVHHQTLGKFIAGFGIGTGILGILILLITTLMAGTAEFLALVVVMSQSIGWIGTFISIWGTMTVEKEPK